MRTFILRARISEREVERERVCFQNALHNFFATLEPIFFRLESITLSDSFFPRLVFAFDALPNSGCKRFLSMYRVTI